MNPRALTVGQGASLGWPLMAAEPSSELMGDEDGPNTLVSIFLGMNSSCLITACDGVGGGVSALSRFTNERFEVQNINELAVSKW